MATAEWSQGEGSIPAMVSSTDLFDGELFGDELIDIYNSTVSEENADMNGIPTLEPSTAKSGEIDQEHPGAQVAAAAAAMDDGLGAFRPSTSFNDLGNLMQPQGGKPDSDATTAAAATEQGGTAAEVKPSSTTTTAAAETGTAAVSRKRSASTSADPPSPKRKAPASARARKAPTKKQPSPTTKAKTIAVPQATPAAGAVVTPATTVGEEAAATAAAVEAAAAAAAAAATFPSIPDLSAAAAAAAAPTAVTSGVTLTMKNEERPPNAIAKAVTAEKITSSAGLKEGMGQDAQFKSIAQQAVSNLILNANNTARGAPLASKCSKTTVTKDAKAKVDTSTAHIKALTGNNWVAACSGSSSTAAAAPAPVGAATPASAPQPTTAAVPSSDASASSAAAAADKNNNRIRRQNLTPDERARQNRDRNREHARNTRLRKKAYVEELKRTLTELVAQRDAADLERRQAAQREVEQREVRFRVIEEFLKLRGRNEANFARWAAILESGFHLTVPSVPSLFKNTLGSEVVGFEQRLTTVEQVMAESTAFSSFLQAIRGTEGAGVTLAFDCDRKNFLMDGCNALLEWTASSVGSKQELAMKGLVRAKFSPASNKLLVAALSFDSGAVAAQIQSKKNSNGEEVTNAAAQAAASQADAILDSLEINHVHLNVVAPSDVSEKGNESSDEQSTAEHIAEESKVNTTTNKTDENKEEAKAAAGDAEAGLGMTTRRVQRRD
mmetsp:Transcript_2283/g.5011  ORF Transcript_2283/g.5011 Transcript_2283/m.5011 type:complete len:725 (+) Transcript_2283:605-2779(+)